MPSCPQSLPSDALVFADLLLAHKETKYHIQSQEPVCMACARAHTHTHTPSPCTYSGSLARPHPPLTLVMAERVKRNKRLVTQEPPPVTQEPPPIQPGHLVLDKEPHLNSEHRQATLSQRLRPVSRVKLGTRNYPPSDFFYQLSADRMLSSEKQDAKQNQGVTPRKGCRVHNLLTQFPWKCQMTPEAAGSKRNKLCSLVTSRSFRGPAIPLPHQDTH